MDSWSKQKLEPFRTETRIDLNEGENSATGKRSQRIEKMQSLILISVLLF